MLLEISIPIYEWGHQTEIRVQRMTLYHNKLYLKINLYFI